MIASALHGASLTRSSGRRSPDIQVLRGGLDGVDRLPAAAGQEDVAAGRPTEACEAGGLRVAGLAAKKRFRLAEATAPETRLPAFARGGQSRPPAGDQNAFPQRLQMLAQLENGARALDISAGRAEIIVLISHKHTPAKKL
jgi:hypothetical protein